MPTRRGGTTGPAFMPPARWPTGRRRHSALVVWASGDRVMPAEHGRRLTELLPQGQLVEVEDSYTLIPLDQPTRFAQIIRQFTARPRQPGDVPRQTEW